MRDRLLGICVFIKRRIVVYYSGDCPTDAQRHTKIIEISKLVVALFLQSVPGRPEIGKWTKDPPATDWFVCVAVLLPFRALVHNAYHHIKVEIVDATLGEVNKMDLHAATGVLIVIVCK